MFHTAPYHKPATVEVALPTAENKLASLSHMTINSRKIRSENEFMALLGQELDGEYSQHIYEGEWFVHEGDLVVERYEAEVNLLVTGNLTVKESLMEIKSSLVVSGKTELNSLFLGGGGNHALFLDGVEFTTALVSYITGPFKVLNHPIGPFLYNHSDSTYISNPKGVECLVDFALGESHGDVHRLLAAEYIDVLSDGDYSIPVDKLREDLRAGKCIFRDVTAS